MNRRKFLALCVAAAGALFAASQPVSAHHSFAMFDFERNVSLEGVVTEFQWTNPHTWVDLDVTDPQSKQTIHWAIEGPAPSGLRSLGWRSDSLQPGARVVIVIHPLKDGRHGGSLVSVSVDGKPIGTEVSKEVLKGQPAAH